MGKEKVFNPSRRSLYDQMKNHYNLPEYNQFESYLDDDNNRKALFDDLSGQSLLGDVKDFEEFETLIKPRVSPELRSEFISQSADEFKKDIASGPTPFEPDKTQYQSPIKQEAVARETQGSPVLQQAMLDTALMESGMLPQLQSDIQKEIQEQESTDKLLNTYREAKIRTLIEEIEDLSSNQNIKGNKEAESYAQSVNDELAAYTPEEVESVRKKIIVERSQSYAKKRINELNAQKGKSVWTAIQDGDFGDPNRLFTGRLKEKSDLIKSQRARLDEKNLLQEAIDQPNKSEGKFNDFVKGIESELGTDLIPFVGNAIELEKFARIREIAQKQDRTEDEQAVVDAYAALQNVKNNSELTPMFYNIGKGATAMTPYALEFAATSGVYSTAKNIMQHGIIKLIGRETVKEVLENAAKKNVIGLLNKGALKGIASLGAGVTQSLANPLGIAVDFEQRGIPLLSLGMSKEGEIVERNALGSPDESITKLLKSIGVNAAEYVSERFGYAVEKPLELLAKMAVGKFLAKYGKNATEKELEAIAKKLGWNGIIAEFAEEFLNKPMQTAIEKGKIEFMSPEESLETLGIVAVPGLGGKAVKYSAKAFNALGSLPKLDPSELKNDKPQSSAESERKTAEPAKPESGGLPDNPPVGNEVNPPKKVEPSKPAAAPEPEKKVQLKPEERAEFLYPNLIERLDQEGEDAPVSVSSVISMIPELQSGDRKSNVKTATKLIQRLHQEGLAVENIYKKKKEDPEQPWKDKAIELGITFVGMQSVPGKESIPLFTDPESGSTFVKSESETVEQALERKREQFKQPKPATPENSETPEAVVPPVVPADKEADKKPDEAVVVKGDDEGLFPGEKLTLKPFVRPELPFKDLDVKSSEKVLDYNARIQDILSARYKGYLDVLDNRINSIDAEITKSVKGSALSKALEHEQIKLKIEREQWEKEYGDLVEERYLEHRESILDEATKRGVIFVDETEENDFVDDFLLQIGNDNATAEKNGDKSLKDVFDSVAEKYLAKGEEPESPAVEPQKEEPEPVEPSVEKKQPKNEVIPPADIAQVSEDILDKTWIKRRSEGQYIQDNNTFTRQDPLAESEGKVAFGKNTSVVFAKEVNAPARYAVIDVSLLQPSHISGSPNKLHFIPEAQPKNRSQSESNRNQNQEMAENLDPEQILVGKTAYVGAPTVNDRGEIIQGNGRGGTARIYWTQYPDDPKGLKSTIKEYASVFGLDEEKIDAIKHPVVVRVFTGNDNQSITLGQYEVSDLESVANKTTKATAMSRKMSDEDVQKIAEMIHRADSGEFDKPIGEIIQAAGLPIVDTLISGGAINADKRETYFSRDGRISPDGVESIKNILVNFLFRGGNTNVPELFRKTPANFQAAVERSVHFLLSSKDPINTEIQNAILMYDGFIKSGMGGIMDFIRQPGLTESAPIDKYGVESSTIALMIEQPQRELIAKFKRYFLNTNGTPGDMFSEGNPPMSKRDSFAAFDPFFTQAKEYGLPDADNKFFGSEDVDVSVFEPRSTYKAMKAKYPGTVFLIRKGENYVARGQDAIDINNALGAKPSKANIYEIPASAIQQILPRLSKAGLRIGVADQIEDQENADSQLELGFDSPGTKTFTTTDGESIRYQNVSGEARYKRSTDNRLAKSPATRTLEKDEQQFIARLYRKSPFRFFGAHETIRGPKDVAVLFRQLETEGIEHTFVVHIREDNKAIVQHISTGVFDSAYLNNLALADFAERFGTKSVYFVHNHPSGNLEPSYADVDALKALKKGFPNIQVQDGIIIDVKEGKYSTFNDSIESVVDSTKNVEAKIPFKSLIFSRQVFLEDVELGDSIVSAQKVAEFVSASRYSSGGKNQVLSLNPHNKVVGRFTLSIPLSQANDQERLDNIISEITAFVSRSGGVAAIIVGNKPTSHPAISSAYNHVKSILKKRQVILNDYVGVEQSNDVVYSIATEQINAREDSAGYIPDGLNEKAYNGLYKINGFFIEKGVKTPSVLARLAALKIGNNIIKYPGEFKKSVIDALGFFAESPSAEFISASVEQIRLILENAITENKNGQTENEIIGQYIRAVRTNAPGSGDPNAGTDGGSGRSGRPGLRVVDEGNIPQPTEIVPADRFAISEHQRLAVNLALTRFVEKKKKAFLLADGTGAGKTRTEIIVAYELAKRLKKPALITTYDDTVIEGFRRESQALGIDLEASNIEIGTYYNLAAGKKAGSKGGAEYARRDYSVHILDEAHRIKNVDSIRAQMSSAVKSDHLVYATATPMDKPLHSAYFMSEVIEQSPEEIAKQLGFEIVKTPMPDGKIETSVIPLSNMSWLVVLDNLLKMRDQAIADGAMIRREYPFFGTVNKKMVQFSQEQRDELDQIEQHWYGFIKAAQARIQPMIDALQYRFDRGEINPAKFFKELQIIRASKNFKKNPLRKSMMESEFGLLRELSYWTEMQKLQTVFEDVMQALDEGKRVIVYAQSVNPGTLEAIDQDPTKESTIAYGGFLKTLGEMLSAKSIDFARIYGSDSDKITEADRFQRGTFKVALATMESGGVGINLDDTSGDAPRKMLIVTANYAGDATDQAMGRISRMNTKSASEVIFYFAPEARSDRRRGVILGKKMNTLRRIQSGEDPDRATFEVPMPAERGSLFDPVPKSEGVWMEPYLDGFVIVKGNTASIKGALKKIGGGRYNGTLKGWIFQKSKRKALESELSDVLSKPTGEGSIAKEPAADYQGDLFRKNPQIDLFSFEEESFNADKSPETLSSNTGVEAESEQELLEFEQNQDGIVDSQNIENEIPGPPASGDQETIEESEITDFGEVIGDARKHKAQKGVFRRGKKDDRPGWMKKYVVLENEKNGLWGVYITLGNHGQIKSVTGDKFSSKGEAEFALPLVEVSLKHRVYTESRSDEKQSYGIFRKIGDRRLALVKGGFATSDDATKYMVTNAMDIINFRFPFPERPYLENIVRVGPTRLKGNVTPKMFQDVFGFRGGQFGNWVTDYEGQQSLNHAFEALLDLADVLNVPPKAISLNGDLAIAFGARGHGGFNSAAAHYEPSWMVINLTKIHGAGALAHEWMHALDHYLARLDGSAGTEREESGKLKNALKAVSYASHGFLWKDNKSRQELRDAFVAMVKSLQYKEVDREIKAENEEKSLSRAVSNLDYYLNGLTSTFNTRHADKYKGKAKKPTEDQIKEWNELVAVLRSGDVGKEKTIQSDLMKRWGNYRSSYDALEKLNDLYKKVIGRYFFTSDRGSTGNYIYHGIRQLNDAKRRLAEANAGATEKKKVTTDFYSNARDLDRSRSSSYWSTPHELLARAFETFVTDKLTEMQRRSDYLIYGADNKFYVSPFGDMKPYLEGEERPVIHQAIQKFVDTIKTDETSKGVAIYEPRIQYGSLASRYQDEFISQQLRQGQTRQLEEKQRRDQKEAERLKRESLQTRATELSDRRKQLQREMEFKPTIIGRAELTSVEKELNEITSRLSDGLFSREDDQQSLFRLDQTPGKGLTKKRLEQLFKPFITGLKDQSIVQIVSSKDDIPDNLKKYALPGVKAFFLPVKGRPVIHFIASEIRDEVDALKTFIHEMGAHYGIRGYLGYEKSNELYRQLWNDYQQEIRQAEWFPRYSTFKQYDPNTTRGQIALAEEYVARSFAEPSIDEDGNIVEPSFLEKIVAAIRQWLRDIGVKTKITDEEIKALLYRSYEFIRGERPGYYGKVGGLRYSIERKNTSILQNIQQMHDTLSDLLPENNTSANLKDLVRKYVRVGKFPQDAVDQSQIMEWIDSREDTVSKSDVLKFVLDAMAKFTPASDSNDPYTIAKSDGYPLPLFLYVGENISNGEGYRIIDNLSVAVDMEQSLKSPDQIRIATGWFKGLDGKWRIEIDDSKSSVNEAMWKRMISNDPYYSDPLDGVVETYTSGGEEKFQLVDKDGHLIQNGFSTKEEAIQWFKKYGGEFRIPNTAYLDELLHHEELFSLYPQLRDIKVSAVPPVRGQHGAFWADRATIEISALMENSTQIKSVLMHEVQHAIQYLEGFASGSNYWSVGEFKYRRSAGEIESRDVQNRLLLDDLGRQDVPPISRTLLDEGIQTDEIHFEYNGISHSIKESDLLESMNKNADPFRSVKLNKINWLLEFGSEGIVKTPIGEVKFGNDQYRKMGQQDRIDFFGLVKPTLEVPQIVVEDGDAILFIKTFSIPNSNSKYFVSVTKKENEIDIVVSNQFRNTGRVRKLVKTGRLLYVAAAIVGAGTPLQSQQSPTESGSLDNSNLRNTPDDVNTDDLDDEVRFSIASNPAITEAKQRIDAMAEDRRELFKSDANDAYKDPLKYLGWITRPSVILGRYSKMLQRSHDVVIAEESFMQDAVMEESKALMNQINEHLYTDMPEKSDRTGFEVLDFVWRMNQRKKLDSFLRMSIPLAAHLNAVGGEASNWEFKEFEMRAGFISKMQLEKLRQSNPGLGVGQTIEVVNPLLTQVSAIKAADEKGLKDAERRAFIAEFMETSPVTDQRIIGEELSDTAGKPGYQLKRVVSMEMQESLYKIYENEYPSFIHLIDQFIDPRLAKKTKEINGIKVPTFNRFALAELMKLNDQEFQDVTGYTPDVYISRSLIGTVKDLGRAIFGGQKSPGRKYKTGSARETGNVQDILKGFNIRAFQALREKARQEFVRMAMATSVPVPANDAIPEGWVKIEDGISTVIQAIETAKKMRLKPFTREMTPDERKKYGKMVLLPEWIVDINLESNTITIQPAHEIKKRLRPQDNLIRDYDFGEFVREARALEGEKRMMPKRVLEILVQQFDSYKVQNGLLRMINYMAQEAALSLLVFPATFMVNYNTNKLFTMEKLGRSTTSLIVKGLLRTVGIKTDPAGEFNALKEVATVSAKGMFLGIQKRIGTDFAKHVEQVVPAALFKHSTVLSDVVASDFDSAKKSIRRGSIAGALLQVLGYGNIDIKSKQRYALSFLTARAKAEASNQGLTGETRKTFVAQWLSNVTMKDRMDAVRAAEFEYLNYKDIPHDLTRFQQMGWSRLFIPFIRFGYSYTLKQKDKIWDKGLMQMIQGETVDQRVEGFANALWATMIDFGLIGIMYGLLGFGDDEDARQLVGASQAYEETPGGQLRMNSLESDMNTENRANISKMAPQWFVGWMKQSGIVGDDEDAWLRLRNYPMLFLPMLGMLSANDARKHGIGEGIATYLNGLIDLGKDFFNFGFAVKTPVKGLQSITRAEENPLDKYGSNIPFVTYTTMNALDAFVPWGRQADEIVLFLDPVRRRTSESRTLDYNTEISEQFKNGLVIGHIPGIVHRMITEGEDLPPTGRVESVSLRPSPSEKPETTMKRQLAISLLSQESPNARLYVQERKDRMGVFKPSPRIAFLEPREPNYSPARELLRLLGGVNIKPVNTREYEQAISNQSPGIQENE